jgi:peptide/nickel transport system substrate-binding protein
MIMRLLGCVLALILPAGCGDTRDVAGNNAQSTARVEDPGQPVTGDWLLIHMLGDPEQLNPLTSNDGNASEVLSFVFETLLTRDSRTLELKPYIAEARPTISEDKLTYTFKIRDDVRFQDGRPVTGEDVLFSIKAIKSPFVNAPFLRVYFNALSDAQLVDSYTIRMSMREPYFLNESVLGGIVVLPRHYYDPENLLKNVTVRDLAGDPSKLGDEVKRFSDNFNRDYSRNPMGSGPFKFNAWKTGREVELLRDGNYWGKGKEAIDQVYMDRIKFRIINNQDAALVTLKSGGLDFIDRLTPVQHVRGTSSERFKRNFQKLEYFYPYYSYLGWNNDHPIFGDKRVRQAMTYLTDRKQILKTVMFGLGEVVDSPIYIFRPEYDKTLESYPYDPQKALTLLKEAGWADTDGDGVLDKVVDGERIPFRFEFKIPSGAEVSKSISLVLQDEMKRYGIASSVRELDWTIFLADVKNHKFDVVLMAWGMQASEPDAYQVWHSSQAANKGSNHISYKNPRVDKILEEYRREFDAEKRIEMYREFQRILHDEQPYTFLFARKYVSAVHRRFQGVEVYPNGLKPAEWWVPRSLQIYGIKEMAS